MTVTPKLDLIVLDCPEPRALARFYADLLGYGVEQGSTDAFVVLDPPGGGVSPERPDGRPTLAFQRIDGYVAPTWPGDAHPQQFHLDLCVDDLDAGEARALALGARTHDHQPAENGSFRVFLDPAGHPFCLVRARSSSTAASERHAGPAP